MLLSSPFLPSLIHILSSHLFTTHPFFTLLHPSLHHTSFNMRFSSASFVAAAIVAALTFADVARAVDPNDPVVKACVRKCDLAQATDFETAVKTYPNPKDKQRLSVIKWATVYRGHCISECYDP
jgi:hypothetical protein